MTNPTDSTPRRKPDKPDKPRDDFPLTPRTDGRWYKKINGKHYYFTGTADEALEKYETLVGELGAQVDERPQVRDLCEAFMQSKLADMEAGELTVRSFREYKMCCDQVVKHFGKLKRLEDLTRKDAAELRSRLAQGVGAKTLAGRVVRTRSVFIFGQDRDLLIAPFHKWIKNVDSKTLKRHRAKRPPRTMSAGEVRALIDGATPPMDAMLLLAINCGFGNSDCADLEEQWLDLEGGWHNFPRFKTGEDRRGRLWPATVQSIRNAVALRPVPKDPAHAGRVFLTTKGTPWVKEDRSDNALAKSFTKLANSLDIKRPGLSFYTLRHVFETVGGGCRDQVAVNVAMGHVDPTMAANYRHGIEDDRLERVADHVHRWLYGRPMREDERGGLRVVG